MRTDIKYKGVVNYQSQSGKICDKGYKVDTLWSRCQLQ
jgi:hypothetical protein